MAKKLQIVCDGRGTYVELDGKTLARGVNYVKFEHDGNTRKPMLEVRLDLSEFSFMPDGRFDEVVKRLSEAEPPGDESGRLS